MPGWKYYISYCIFLLFEVVFVWFMIPETHGRSLEELAFRAYSHALFRLRSIDLIRFCATVYEGDKIREEQQKRIEDELNEIEVPASTEKESVLDEHIEVK